MPGTYQATLGKREAGKYTALTKLVSFTILPDPLSSLTADGYKEIAAFNKQVKTLRKAVNATISTNAELATKLEQVKAALELAPKADEPAKLQVRELIEKVRVSQRNLRGDSVLAARNENVPESISARAGYAASATSSALAKPTGSQQQAYTDAGKLLAAEVATLRELLDKDLPALEKKLEELGAPPLPGRLPKLVKE